MNGIDILNQVEITTAAYPLWVGAGLFCISLVAIIYGVYLIILDNGFKRVFGIVGCVIGGVAFYIGIITSCMTSKTGKYQYEVTIDESVSMTEFYEKYDVVEQRGSIWVIEEKED